MPEFGRRTKAPADTPPLDVPPAYAAEPTGEPHGQEWVLEQPLPRAKPPRGKANAKFWNWWPLTIGFVAVSILLGIGLPSMMRVVGMEVLIPTGIFAAVTLGVLALQVVRTLDWLRAGGMKQALPGPAEPKMAMVPLLPMDMELPAQMRAARIGPTADGVVFEFPPSRGSAGVLTAVLFVSTALLILMVVMLPMRLHGFVLLAAAWGLIDYFLLLAVLRLWLVTEKIVIGPEWIAVTAGLFGGTKRMRRDAVRSIAASRGLMTLHHAIRIKGDTWRGFLVGDGIRDWLEAEWLAARMARLAGIAEAPARQKPPS